MSIAQRAIGYVRLVHPFPIALDAAVTFAIALIAGAALPRAVLLGLGMLGLQASIGALNDVVDVERDRDRKRGKPIPAGLVGRGPAAVLAIALGILGVVLGRLAGPGPGLVGIAVLSIGWSYDLWFKGTAWSWLPFALGLPLLPVYAWLGATGAVPAGIGLVVPAGAAAGAALAIANALVDTERDRAAGVTSIAASLGEARAWQAHVALHLAVAIVAVVGLLALGRPLPLAAAAVGLPVAVIGIGAAMSRGGAPSIRERGWRLEALGTGLLAAAWLWLAAALPG